MLHFLFKKIAPIFYTTVLSSCFFWSLVLLDTLMEKSVAPSLRVATSHIIILFITFVVIYLLPGGFKEWGANLRQWQRSLMLGVILGLATGAFFSFLSYGTNIRHWNVTSVITQLRNRQNIILLLSQIFLIGSSEEFFFRGLLVTYLMKKYSMKLLGIHSAVIIISVLFASVHFYKLLFGATFKNILPLGIGGFFYGLVLGWGYQKTGSLIGPIILHNLCNSFMFVISIGIGN